MMPCPACRTSVKSGGCRDSHVVHHARKLRISPHRVQQALVGVLEVRASLANTSLGDRSLEGDRIGPCDGGIGPTPVRVVHHHPARADEVAAGASDGEVVDGRDRVAGADLRDRGRARDALRGHRAEGVALGEVPGGDPAAVNGVERLDERDGLGVATTGVPGSGWAARSSPCRLPQNPSPSNHDAAPPPEETFKRDP